MKKDIDVIIPVHNSKNTLSNTLASIVSQTLNKQVIVTIIDDCSSENYNDLIELYSNLVEINYYKLEKNVGPGMARQYGLEHTDADFITFVDSDDLLSSPLSLHILYNYINLQNPNGENLNAVYGQIQEVLIDNFLCTKIPPNHLTWIFGSMFRRSFVEENNINFIGANSFSAEDTYFNKSVKLMSQPDRLGTVDTCVYLWTDSNKDNRLNNDFFKYIYSKLGFIQNICTLYKKYPQEKTILSKEDYKVDSLATLLSIYFQFSEICNHVEYIKQADEHKEYEAQSKLLIEKTFEFFDLVIRPRLDEIKEDDIKTIYNINVDRFSERADLGLARVSFFEYFDCLKNGDFNRLYNYIS